MVFMNGNLSLSTQACARGAAKVMLKEKVKRILEVYTQTCLALKDEDSSVFAGVDVKWNESRFWIGQHFSNDLLEIRYQNACSFAPQFMKVGMVICQYVAILDRSCDMNWQLPLCKLTISLLRAGCSRCISHEAFGKITMNNSQMDLQFKEILKFIPG